MQDTGYVEVPNNQIILCPHCTKAVKYLDKDRNNYLICVDENCEYIQRLEKKHNHFDDGTLEMQSLNSSDALLMNIFCYPEVFKWKGLTDLLEIEPDEIKFGWQASFPNEKHGRATEIDMKIGSHIFEAKLTEENFTDKEVQVIKGYLNFQEVFNPDMLLKRNGKIESYQLIRNFLVAFEEEFSFTLLVDERRPDLIRKFYEVREACKDEDLRKRTKFVTWQELTSKVGQDLKGYLNRKYFANDM